MSSVRAESVFGYHEKRQGSRLEYIKIVNLTPSQLDAIVYSCGVELIDIVCRTCLDDSYLLQLAID
jgi:hypothetical protein